MLLSPYYQDAPYNLIYVPPAMTKAAQKKTPTIPDTGVATALEKAAWQKVLFATKPSRYQLGLLEPRWPLEAVGIHVHRNQPFEFVAGLIPAFAAYSDLCAKFTYSEYDDALNFSGHGTADVEILWLDFDRYANNLTPDKLINWLAGRLDRLREQSGASILVCNWASAHPDAGTFNELFDSHIAGIADTFVCDQATVMSTLGSDYFDDRNITLAGSALSNVACVETARMFGLTWIPSVIHPRLKAIVVDLDNTLYAGIIEEDGIDNLQLEAHHIELQKQLSALQKSGVLLAICSRNNAETVDRMFRRRKDFPLSLDRFSAVVASWSSKATGLLDIAATLSIGADSILFIDDNPAELAAVVSAFPEIHTLLARESPVSTHEALSRFPRLHQWHEHREDTLRSADIVANRERHRLRNEIPDNAGYLEALEMELMFHVNPKHLHSRLHELSIKTNQFNTAMLRLSEHEITSRLSDPECFTIAVGLKDRLSESGVVGVLFSHAKSGTAVVDEICISCRALGREIETIILVESLQKIMHLSSTETVTIKLTRGPRNAPAIKCLDSIFQPVIQAGGGCFEYQCGAEQLLDIQTRNCVNILWES